MKQVFPIVIANQIGLPMNVCTECVKTVETFYMFSSQVLANQNKLLATLPNKKTMNKKVPTHWQLLKILYSMSSTKFPI
ncbi:AGAP006929-PA [Anopheles gambiae str. PEST]|uniref:AGAP006929-PA n=1 Tax=Anopheles gambiae TaxID=7165 RepID=A0NBM0_ANOGA|nr:AGAP006929-PA [Anopheles gambiae str. PEST]